MVLPTPKSFWRLLFLQSVQPGTDQWGQIPKILVQTIVNEIWLILNTDSIFFRLRNKLYSEDSFSRKSFVVGPSESEHVISFKHSISYFSFKPDIPAYQIYHSRHLLDLVPIYVVDKTLFASLLLWTEVIIFLFIFTTYKLHYMKLIWNCTYLDSAPYLLLAHSCSRLKPFTLPVLLAS